MAERSQFWNTSTTGDGATTISEAQTIEWFRDVIAPFSSAGPNTTQGILRGVLGELAPSGTATPIAIAAGAAIVEGFYYKNTDVVNFAIPTPNSATRYDRIVLRADHSARTVRLARLEGVEGGGGAPAVTQIAGTTWEIQVAHLTVLTNGTIIVTDERSFAHFATKVSGAMLDANVADGTTLELSGTSVRIRDNGVSNAKLRDSAALSVIGRSANSSGDPADITASSDGHVLRRSGTVLGFGQVATAGIANDAIDDTKVGNRVPQLPRRQGGNSTNWNTAGTTDYTPGMVKMQLGVYPRAISIPAGTTVGERITFPQAFGAAPIVFVSLQSLQPNITYTIDNTTATYVDIRLNNNGPNEALGSFGIQWLAIGPE